LFAVPTMSRPWAFIVALIIGSVVTALVYLILKKPVSATDLQEEKEEEDLNLKDLKISD
ncbi:PTS fructose transporter subunit IIC, partial [Lacticaseibacillus paracasei]|nr:PTS fructose transporter subunit IIC [Lacticaseibacillus paracasei]